jgi:hypothetical protein
MPTSRTNHPLIPWLLGLLGLIIVTVSARPYVGGWNDGSRLATVESIADWHTMAIDDSIFCRPAAASASGHSLYAPEAQGVTTTGTLDKLRIGRHFYSDKPAVISFLMAGLYQTFQWLGLPTAAQRPDLFIWAMTVTTAGLAYILAIVSLHRLGLLIGLPPRTHWLWLGSFGLSTFALAYTRHVNNHIMLLAVVAISCLELVHLKRDFEAGQISLWRLAGLGTLAGLGFNLDLGSGPLLTMAMLGLVVYRCRRSRVVHRDRFGTRYLPVATFVLAVAPWVAAGTGLNYAIGGVWIPVNMVAEYSAWPGGPFSSANLTGHANHGPFKLLIYSAALLFGKHGVFTHNLPMLLVVPALVPIFRRASQHRPELVFSIGWCIATWLLYSVLSNNYAGACCSIRWFVPFLAPCYFLLAVFLEDRPEYRTDFLILSLWGSVLAAIMWWYGPWIPRMVPLVWPIAGSALLTWMAYRLRVLGFISFPGARSPAPVGYPSWPRIPSGV